MEVEAEVVRQFVSFEDVIEQALVARAKQNRVVSHVIVSDVRPKIQNKQGHRPVHFFQLFGALLRRFRGGIEMFVGVMNVGV